MKKKDLKNEGKEKKRERGTDKRRDYARTILLS